jgi:hypothetical protein
MRKHVPPPSRAPRGVCIRSWPPAFRWPCDRARNRINLVPPGGSFTDTGLALYEEVLKAQSETLADGAAEPVGFYETA